MQRTRTTVAGKAAVSAPGDVMSVCSHKEAPARTRVLVVDDHYVMRAGLCEMLKERPGFAVPSAVADARQALEITRRQPFDLAIVDISLGETDGITLTGMLKSEHPDLVVLILSMHEEAVYGARAAGAGAAGFVEKQRASETLLPAIDCVLHGGHHFSCI